MEEALAYMYSIGREEDISESNSELVGSDDREMQEEFGHIYSSYLLIYSSLSLPGRFSIIKTVNMQFMFTHA